MPKSSRRKATPAQRARARRDPAVFRPPPRIRDRSAAVRALTLRVDGRAYPIGAHVEGDTPWALGMDQTGTVTLPLRDPSDSLRRILGDESRLVRHDGARIAIDGVVYVVDGVDYDGDGLYTLTLEDEVSWRLDAFTSFRSASRATTTRFGFIASFVREASRKPYPPMRAFIPEVDDKQPVRKPPPKEG